MCSMSFDVAGGLKALDPLSCQEPAALAAAAAEAYSKQAGPFANGGTFASALLPLLDFASKEGSQTLNLLLCSTKVDLAQSPHGRPFDKTPREVCPLHPNFPG